MGKTDWFEVAIVAGFDCGAEWKDQPRWITKTRLPPVSDGLLLSATQFADDQDRGSKCFPNFYKTSGY